MKENPYEPPEVPPETPGINLGSLLSSRWFFWTGIFVCMAILVGSHDLFVASMRVGGRYHRIVHFLDAVGYLGLISLICLMLRNNFLRRSENKN